MLQLFIRYKDGPFTSWRFTYVLASQSVLDSNKYSIDYKAPIACPSCSLEFNGAFKFLYQHTCVKGKMNREVHKIRRRLEAEIRTLMDCQENIVRAYKRKRRRRSPSPDDDSQASSESSTHLSSGYPNTTSVNESQINLSMTAEAAHSAEGGGSSGNLVSMDHFGQSLSVANVGNNTHAEPDTSSLFQILDRDAEAFWNTCEGLIMNPQ